MKIAIIPGSARKESVNRKLARVAAGVAADLGIEAVVIDPPDHVLPLFDQDLEERAFPEEASRLKRMLKEVDALVFCSPEYNSSITPLTKNLIDWTSRAEREDESPLEVFHGKKAVLLSASPGGLGGLRGLVHLRSILGNIGVWVSPKQHAVSGAYGKFSDEGELTDEKDLNGVRTALKSLLD